MTYIKTVDTSGNVISVEAVSAVAGGPSSAVPAMTLASGQFIITQDEFNTLVAKIRGSFP